MIEGTETGADLARPSFDPEVVPAELRTLPQWVARRSKVLVDPKTGRNAKTNDPVTWSTFEEAVGYAADNGLDGIGLVFTEGDPFAFVDLDSCMDLETGEITPGAARIVDDLDSYTEISSSGRGLHVVVRGEKPGPRCKDKNRGVEMYDRRQYLAVSGRPLPGRRTTVEDRGGVLALLYRETFGDAQEDGPDGELPEPASPPMCDEEIVAKIRASKQAEKFARLYDEGGLSEYDGDHSSGDLALCGMLGFFAQDPEQIDRLFRESALYRPKWEREDYRDRTIRRALVGKTEFYGREYDPGEVVFIEDDDTFEFAENGAHDADDTHDIVTPGSSPPRAPRADDARDTYDAMTPHVPPIRPDAADAAFPVHVLPPSLGRFVREAGHAKEAPVEFVAVPMLAALGTAIGASRRFLIERTWQELPTLYTAVVAPPASGKSPAEDAAFAPIERQKRVLNQRYKIALEKYKEEYGQWEAEAQEARKKKGRVPPEPEKPVKERIRVGDATVEALQLRMVENPRGLVLARDELAGFFNSLNQYRQGADREFWLSQHSGRVPAIDRKSADESYDIDHPCVSVVGSIQPDKLKVLDIEARDGMVERFLFAWPEAKMQPDAERDISVEAEEDYHRVWDALYALEMGEDEFAGPAPRDVPLSPEAAPAWKAYKRALKHSAYEPGTSTFMQGVLGKMKAHFPRFALILALVRTAESGGPREEVREKDLDDAWELVVYFVAQAHRIYTELQGASREDLLAHALGRFLDKSGGSWEGTATELYDTLKELGHEKALPKKPDALTQAVLKAVGKSPALHAEKGQRTAQARSIVIRREYAS